MNEDLQPGEIVILGAGALSLGFFGPVLSGDYALTYLDTKAKEDFVTLVGKRRGYAANIAADRILPLAVRGVDAFRLDLPDRDGAIRERVARANIFITAVGVRNLDSALTWLIERIRERRDSIHVLCAENGEDVAEKWRGAVPANIRLCDTVMGRMCRLEESPAPDYESVGPGVPWGVVAEDFHGIPLSGDQADPRIFRSPAFQVIPPEEFHARERVKLLAHNGLHFFIAAQGRLRGLARFSDMRDDPSVAAPARELLETEIAPALWKNCAWRIGRAEFDGYIAHLPARLFSPTLRDQVARGVRGIREKFAPNERVLGGLRLLRDNGIRPNRYYDLIAAGLEVARRDDSGETAARLLRDLPDEESRREVESRWKRLQ